jgi:hypothetical protein
MRMSLKAVALQLNIIAIHFILFSTTNFSKCDASIMKVIQERARSIGLNSLSPLRWHPIQPNQDVFLNSPKLLKGGGGGKGGGGSSGGGKSGSSSAKSPSPSPSSSKSPSSSAPSPSSKAAASPSLSSPRTPSASVRVPSSRPAASSSQIVWSSGGRAPVYYSGFAAAVGVRPWFLGSAAATSCNQNYYSYGGRCRSHLPPS